MAFAIHNITAHQVFARLLRDDQICAHLDALEKHHAETHAHCLRVGLLSIDLGMDNCMDGRCLQVLGSAALLHDIGKLRIPANLLSKPERLDAHELALLRDHPRLGSEMLQNFPPPIVAEVVAAHHAYGDDPYPHPLEIIPVTGGWGETARPSDPDTSVLAQIVAAADIFDALNTPRAYKAPFTCGQTRDAMYTQYQGELRYLQQVLARCASPVGLG